MAKSKKVETDVDNYKDFIDANTPKKRGRPRKDPNDTAPRKSNLKIKEAATVEGKRKERKKVSEELIQLSQMRRDAESEIVKNFHDNLPQYIEKRKQEFEELLERFKIENEVILDRGDGKVDTMELSNCLSKPLYFGGIANCKVSAADISMFFDCYWDCIMKVNKTTNCPPTLMQFCRFLGMSTKTFASYQFNEDANIREMVLMVRDQFIDYYTVKGLKNELNTIMVIFALKAQYGLRDNDAPQTVINNNYTTQVQTDIDDIEKRFNLPNMKSVIDVEV